MKGLRFMAPVYMITYRALDTMGGLILLIVIALAFAIYILQAYLLWVMLLITALVVARIMLWFRARRW